MNASATAFAARDRDVPSPNPVSCRSLREARSTTTSAPRTATQQRHNSSTRTALVELANSRIAVSAVTSEAPCGRDDDAVGRIGVVPGKLDGIHGDRGLERRDRGGQRIERVGEPREDIAGDLDPRPSCAERDLPWRDRGDEQLVTLPAASIRLATFFGMRALMWA